MLSAKSNTNERTNEVRQMVVRRRQKTKNGQGGDEDRSEDGQEGAKRDGRPNEAE
jgi:hypothetical protein